MTLPENPFLATPEDWGVVTEQHSLRATKRASFVVGRDIPNFGRVEEFVEDTGRRITLVKTLAGGHDHLGVQEGLVDIIGKSFGFI